MSELSTSSSRPSAAVADTQSDIGFGDEFMSENKKKFHGWRWSCRPLSDGQLQICLFLPQGAWLNPGNNTPSIVRYLSVCEIGMAVNFNLGRIVGEMESAMERALEMEL